MEKTLIIAITYEGDMPGKDAIGFIRSHLLDWLVVSGSGACDPVKITTIAKKRVSS